MSWRQVVERAGRVDPAATRELPILIQVLEEAEKGNADEGRIRAAVGLPAVAPEPAPDEDEWDQPPPPVPPFLKALDVAIRAHGEGWDTPTLAAVRAVLRELTPVLSRLASVAYGAPPPPASGPDSPAAALARVAAADRGGTALMGSGEWVCPRCHSTDIEVRREDLGDEERSEARCDACGYYASFAADDPARGGFRRAPWSAASAVATQPAAPVVQAGGGGWITIAMGRFRVGLEADEARRLAESSARARRRRMEEDPDSHGLREEQEVEERSGNPAWLEPLLRAALPARDAAFDAYEIAAAPVSNREWREFMRATGAAPPDSWSANSQAAEPERPVLGVSWDQAAAFAAWAGASLPTEAQWERAARGAARRLFPWGDDFGDPGNWIAQQHYYVPWISAEHPELASPDGALDMTSGHWEWVADRFALAPGADAAAHLTLYPGSREGRVRKGGPGSMVVACPAARWGAEADWVSSSTTFRLARTPR